MAVAGNGGACCECAQLVGCNCATVGCSLVCEKKEGIATLCGHAEFTDPSDPPRFYRRLTQVNSQTNDVFSDGLCADYAYAGTCAINAIGRYDKDTCEYVLTGTNNCGPVIVGPFGDSCGIVATTGKTSSSQALDGASPCCPASPVSYRYTVVSGNVELDEEDTENDAEARAKAAIELWTACAACSHVECTAYRSDRTGSGDAYFGFRAVRTRAQWTALVGRSYAVQVRFARRVLGTGGPFLDLGLIYEVTVTTPTIAGITDYIDVPSEAGWETVAYSCAVALLP